MKCIPGDYLMKLVERMPRVCKAIKANGGYFEESTTYYKMCYFIVLMSSLLFYNVESSKKKEKPLNELVCLTFDWNCIYIYESSTNDYVRSPQTHRKTQPFSSQRSQKSTNRDTMNH